MNNLEGQSVYNYDEDGFTSEVSMIDILDGDVLGRDPVYTGAGILDDKFTNKITALNDGDYFGVLVNMVMNPKLYKQKDDIPLIGLYTYPALERGERAVLDRGNTIPDKIESLLVDFDDGDITILEAAAKYRDYNIALYSTASDSRGKKFRMVIELSKPIECNVFTYPENRKKLLEFFEGCDPTTFNWGRYFHIPAVLENSENYSYVIHAGGKLLSAFSDIGLTKDIGDYRYTKKDCKELKDYKGKYSMKQKTSGNATRKEALGRAVDELENIAAHLEERGGGYDLHGHLLRASTILQDVGYNFKESWKVMEAEFVIHNYDRKVLDDVRKEVERMF
jgi:hypothetical protein